MAIFYCQKGLFMNIQPIVNFNRDKNDSADLFCNCPNCRNIIGKITYGYKYEGGVALEGYKLCKTCDAPIDWTKVVDRFQISPYSTIDLDMSNEHGPLTTGLGTKAPKQLPNNMNKCMAILNSLKESANKYLAGPEKEPEIEQAVENVVEYLLTPITEEIDELERD